MSPGDTLLQVSEGLIIMPSMALPPGIATRCLRAPTPSLSPQTEATDRVVL